MHNPFLLKMRKIIAERINAVSLPMETLRNAALAARTPHVFVDIFTSNQTVPKIIAEIKFASPSAGVIRRGKNPAAIARQYLENGAAAISILTEPVYFKGSISYLEAVRSEFPQAKLLMKDFILHEAQLLQARISGADAVLLIVGFLTPQEFNQLYQTALTLQLTPLVEVHSLDELIVAEAAGAKLIGINNRNLHDMTVSLDVSARLIKHVTQAGFVIAESGITSVADLRLLQELGFHGCLIGSHFMRAQQPGESLYHLLEEVRCGS